MYQTPQMVQHRGVAMHRGGSGRGNTGVGEIA
jgi:hypothetical protein